MSRSSPGHWRCTGRACGRDDSVMKSLPSGPSEVQFPLRSGWKQRVAGRLNGIGRRTWPAAQGPAAALALDATSSQAAIRSWKGSASPTIT